MILTKEQVRSAAFQLTALDREALAEELLLSIDGQDSSAIDEVWLNEVRRRDEAFIAGRTLAKPVGDVLDRLYHKDRP